MSVLVEAPRVNANEDNLQLIEIRAVEGQRVEQGEVLFVLETTKAAVEVYAPEAGIVGRLENKVGDFVTVGAVLCELAEETADAAIGTASASDVAVSSIAVTAKARKAASVKPRCARQPAADPVRRELHRADFHLPSHPPRRGGPSSSAAAVTRPA